MIRKFGLFALVVGITAISIYGSYLIEKERNRVYQTAEQNNVILKMIDSRIGSESEININTLKHLSEMIDKQTKALSNHEKIIAGLQQSVDQNKEIIADITKDQTTEAAFHKGVQKDLTRILDRLELMQKH